MGASLTMQRRVREEGLRVVKRFDQGRRHTCVKSVVRLTVPEKQAPANFVPAAAVIRKGQALFGFTGRKGGLGGLLSFL